MMPIRLSRVAVLLGGLFVARGASADVYEDEAPAKPLARYSLAWTEPFPIGTGVSYRDRSGFTAEVRGTYRTTTASDLVTDPVTGEGASLNSWEATAAVGYEL